MVAEYKPIYTVKEMSKVLGIGINGAYRLLNTGEVPFLLINNSKRVRGSDLERFIENYPAERITPS